jgi:hypothetical protein
MMGFSPVLTSFDVRRRLMLITRLPKNGLLVTREAHTAVMFVNGACTATLDELAPAHGRAMRCARINPAHRKKPPFWPSKRRLQKVLDMTSDTGLFS